MERRLPVPSSRLQAGKRYAAVLLQHGARIGITPVPHRSARLLVPRVRLVPIPGRTRAGELLSEVIYARIASRFCPSSQLSTRRFSLMSTLVVLKENNTLILGTDSRFMSGDFTSIASDATQKIFEIGPGTFIATSGRKMACDFQHERARELADELGGPADIQAISAALKRESLP